MRPPLPRLFPVLAILCSQWSVARSADAQTVLRKIMGETPLEQLGFALDAAGDVNNDSFPDLIVGNPQTRISGQGLARVYSGKDGSILHTFRGRTTAEEFGACVSGAGDVNNDGFDDVLIGVPRRQLGGGEVGAVEVYSGRDGSLIHTIVPPPTQREELGRSISEFMDVNQDGHADFLVPAPTFGLLKVIDGRTGLTLRTITTGNTQTRLAIALAGDIDGDGTVDIVFGNVINTQAIRQVKVVSGRTSAILHTFSGVPNVDDGFGTSVCGGGDINGDGTPDLVVGDPGATDPRNGYRRGGVRVFSGRNGAVLHQVYGQGQETGFGAVVVAMGDVNQDGFADFATAARISTVNGGRVRVFSGRDASVLLVVDGPQPSEFGAALGAADMNQDGTPDLMIGAPIESDTMPEQGSVLIVSGIPAATTAVLGDGCSGSPFLPLFRTTKPQLGRNVTLAGMLSRPMSGGVVFLGAAVPKPVELGSECRLYFDPLAFVPLASFATDGFGNWSLVLPLPQDRTYVGMSLALQALLAPTAGPFGFDLTNGVAWRLGH